MLVNSLANNGVCSLVIGVETPRFVSELWHDKGETDVLTLAEEPLNIPLPESGFKFLREAHGEANPPFINPLNASECPNLLLVSHDV